MTHHYEGADLIVRKLEVGQLENNVYVLECPATHEALLVDGCFEPDKILEGTAGASIVGIVQTHGHMDHVQALPELKEKLGVPVYAHPAEEYPIPIDEQLKDGDTIKFGKDHEVKVLHTPGHTPGGVCLHIGQHLVSGDTLFPGGPGNTWGNKEAFETIIGSIKEKLFVLPDDTRVYPGHGKDTTIGDEKPHLEEWIEKGMVIIQHPTGPNDKEPPRYGNMIEFGKRRDAGTGYMAYSDRVGPGVIVLHEFFGLQQSFKDYADRLCEAGFTVLAPDLYDGYIAPDADEALKKAQSLDGEQAMLRLRAAAAHLMDNWHPRLGVIGFSLGAGFAAQMATEMSPEAVVTYYGAAEASPEWKAPLLSHWAEKDEWEDAEYVKEYLAALESNGVDVDSHIYEGTGHWFANTAVPDAYDQDAAALAFERTVDFLHHHLA